MKIENTEVHGFRTAFRAMRNSFSNWGKSDSEVLDSGKDDIESGMQPRCNGCIYYPFDDGATPDLDCGMYDGFRIGRKDLALATRLVKSSASESKFARFITVTCDMTLPLYVWAEMDTYKVGTVRLSTSTMHTLGKKNLRDADFQDGKVNRGTLRHLNSIGISMRNTGRTPEQIRRAKQILPCSFLQMATMQFNYQGLRAIYFDRRKHRLPEWKLNSGIKGGSICDWIAGLPYAKELITVER